jgi:hypothetical protein
MTGAARVRSAAVARVLKGEAAPKRAAPPSFETPVSARAPTGSSG